MDRALAGRQSLVLDIQLQVQDLVLNRSTRIDIRVLAQARTPGGRRLEL